MQSFQFRPLFGMRIPDEVEDHRREDGALAVESLARGGDVSGRQQVVVDDRFEGAFRMAGRVRHGFSFGLRMPLDPLRFTSASKSLTKSWSWPMRKRSYGSSARPLAISAETVPAFVSTSYWLNGRKASSFATQSAIFIGICRAACFSA